MKPTYKELETTLREVAKVLPELVDTAGFGDELEKLVTQAADRLIVAEDDTPAAPSMNHLSDFDNAELLDMFSLLVSNGTKSPLPEEEEKNLLEIQRELLRRMQDAEETHCRMGVACPLHDGQVHGQEASELRKQLEFFIEVDIYSIDETTIDVIGPVKAALQKILDSVDARDSLAFEEQNTDWENPIVTQPGESLIDNVNKTRAKDVEEVATPLEDRVKKLELALDQMQQRHNQAVLTGNKNTVILSDELHQRTNDLRTWHKSLVQYTEKRLHKIFYGHNRHVLQAPQSEQAPGWAKRRAQAIRTWAKPRYVAKIRGCK